MNSGNEEQKKQLKYFTASFCSVLVKHDILCPIISCQTQKIVSNYNYQTGHFLSTSGTNGTQVLVLGTHKHNKRNHGVKHQCINIRSHYFDALRLACPLSPNVQSIRGASTNWTRSSGDGPRAVVSEMPCKCELNALDVGTLFGCCFGLIGAQMATCLSTP